MTQIHTWICQTKCRSQLPRNDNKKYKCQKTRAHNILTGAWESSIEKDKKENNQKSPTKKENARTLLTEARGPSNEMMLEFLSTLIRQPDIVCNWSDDDNNE